MGKIRFIYLNKFSKNLNILPLRHVCNYREGFNPENIP
jgi:hypothetical protein